MLGPTLPLLLVAVPFVVALVVVLAAVAQLVIRPAGPANVRAARVNEQPARANVQPVNVQAAPVNEQPARANVQPARAPVVPVQVPAPRAPSVGDLEVDSLLDALKTAPPVDAFPLERTVEAQQIGEVVADDTRMTKPVAALPLHRHSTKRDRALATGSVRTPVLATNEFAEEPTTNVFSHSSLDNDVEAAFANFERS
ncbi:MAG: hypothetical protein JWO36_262 [Myxococcales bacterium]|nr:hypothetical protein [Myxococcales bacterium]